MEENANGIAGSGGDGDEKTPKQIDADVLQSRADILRAQNSACEKPGQTCAEPATTTTPTPEPMGPTEPMGSTEGAGTIHLARAGGDLGMNRPKQFGVSANGPADKPLPAALRPPGASVGSGHVRLERRPVDVILIDKRTDTASPVPGESMARAVSADAEVSVQKQAERPPGTGSDARAVIPEFNLAERILAEQRRVVAGRRQRSTESHKTPVMHGESRGIGHVVSRISRGDRSCELSGSEAGAVRFAVLPTDAEQSVMAGIVTADIIRLCG